MESDSNYLSQSSKEVLRSSVYSISQQQSQGTKTRSKNEKNFNDLNHSLAKLASRRSNFRSSSDNDYPTLLANPSQPTSALQTPQHLYKQTRPILTSTKKLQSPLILPYTPLNQTPYQPQSSSRGLKTHPKTPSGGVRYIKMESDNVYLKKRSGNLVMKTEGYDPEFEYDGMRGVKLDYETGGKY